MSIDQTKKTKTKTSKDELSEKELDNVVGGKTKNSPKGNDLPTESLSLNFTKISYSN
jgi:bacteriocin-like protein